MPVPTIPSVYLIDYLKYDYCHVEAIPDVTVRYLAMSEAIENVSYPIVFAACEW